MTQGGPIKQRMALRRYCPGTQFHRSLCSISSVPENQSGAKQVAVGFTLEVEASLATLRQEHHGLSFSMGLTQSNVVSVSLIPGLFEKHYNHHF